MRLTSGEQKAIAWLKAKGEFAYPAEIVDAGFEIEVFRKLAANGVILAFLMYFTEPPFNVSERFHYSENLHERHTRA